MKEIFNRNFWIQDDADLRGYSNIEVVGHLCAAFGQNNQTKASLYCPKAPYAPGQHAQAIQKAPLELKALYNVAAKDMRAMGAEPDDLYMYLLHHTGQLEPDEILRASFWHFDLTRLLDSSSAGGDIPIAVNYAVSSALPTIYLTRLDSDAPLPARSTLSNKEQWDSLAVESLMGGHIYIPQSCEIVRYDNLTMHRGAPNDTGENVQRTFMHIAFSPIG